MCSSYKVLFPSSRLEDYEDSNKDVQRHAGATGRFSTGRFSSCPKKTLKIDGDTGPKTIPCVARPGCQPWVASNGRVLAFQRTTCLPVASPRAWSKPLDHGRKVRSSWPNDVGRMQMHRFYGWRFQGVVFFFQTCWMVIKLG